MKYSAFSCLTSLIVLTLFITAPVFGQSRSGRNNGLGAIDTTGVAFSMPNHKIVVSGTQDRKPFLGVYADKSGRFINQVHFKGEGQITRMEVRGDAVWVIGYFGGTLTMGQGGPTFFGNGAPHGNVFIAQYSLREGTPIQLISAIHIRNTSLRNVDLRVDEKGNVYFSASTREPVQFMNGVGGVAFTYVPTEKRHYENFSAKFSPRFKVLWAKPNNLSYQDLAHNDGQ